MAKTRKPEKSYLNKEFITSADGRLVRILAEYLEPEHRFEKYNIVDTIVFFGSARLVPRSKAQRALKKVEQSDPKSPGFPEKLRKAQRALYMSRFYEDAVELSSLLTTWSKELDITHNRFIVSTGGGPGIMEAANKGAKKAGGYSIGLAISLPKEEHINKYVTPQLGFEFHYFFMRKFWFAYLAKALVIFPGGFGTMDELFELLTLVQTGKIEKNLMIIIYGSEYWKEMINFDAFVENGLISAKDLKLFHFCDKPEDAFKLISEFLEKYYVADDSGKEKSL